MYVRAFRDSNSDGHGDLQGLTSRLDYLHSLGVDCLWLLPIYPSPLKDDGYDVSDYLNIHSTYGNLSDFRTLVQACHERTMRVIVDFVVNHTSDQHWWFQEARKSRNSPYRDYYVWSDTPNKYREARIIFLDTEKSNWTWDPVAGQYYWHRFYSSQPDLNFDNPKVREEIFNILKFWLELGVDGFRCDAVPYLFEREGTNCENLPETHNFLKEIRRWIERNYPGRILLAEACQLPHDVCEYFGNGDEFHMAFHFPVMPRIFLALARQDVTTLREILEETPQIPPTCQWVTFLRNHDELTLEMVTPEERQEMWAKYAPHPRMRLNLGIRRRLAPLLDNDRRKIEVAHCLLLTLPGSPILYYGDEIGMGDNIWLPDRNGVRTPMQWDPDDPVAGFSDMKNPEQLYAPLNTEPPFSKEYVNVKDAQRDPSSLFQIIRFLLRLRRQHQAFGRGALQWLDAEVPNHAVASYFRTFEIDCVFVVCNVSSQIQHVSFQIPREHIERINKMPFVTEIITGLRYPLINANTTLSLSLNPYEFLWFNFCEQFKFV